MPLTLTFLCDKIFSMEKKVKIKLISRIYDLQESENIEKYISEHPGYTQDDISTKIELSCKGLLKTEDGRLSLIYKEPEAEGLGDTQTQISFEQTDPETVCLYRTGDIRSDLVFNAQAGRKTCLYQTELLPFELSIVTRKLVNRLHESGGTLHLDYKIEINSMNVERTVLDLMVRALGDGA